MYKADGGIWLILFWIADVLTTVFGLRHVRNTLVSYRHHRLSVYFGDVVTLEDP